MIYSTKHSTVFCTTNIDKPQDPNPIRSETSWLDSCLTANLLILFLILDNVRAPVCLCRTGSSLSVRFIIWHRSFLFGFFASYQNQCLATNQRQKEIRDPETQTENVARPIFTLDRTRLGQSIKWGRKTRRNSWKKKEIEWKRERRWQRRGGVYGGEKKENNDRFVTIYKWKKAYTQSQIKKTWKVP